MADAGPGAVIEAWGRLGYPRRARRLWEAAVRIATDGWPDDLTELPGVGRYTAQAVRAQADAADLPAIEVNTRRVLERVEGQRLTQRAAEAAMIEVGAPMVGRDRLLALMDVGALICRPHEPKCAECPLEPRCATRGPLEDGVIPRRQAPFEGSFRQERGIVLARLRTGPTPIALLDAKALKSLVADGLATIEGDTARLP
jgi:A/G-specific adenine glycosylase